MIRLGAAILAAIIGLFVGLVLAFVCALTGVLEEIDFAVWVFGTSVFFAAVCLVFPSFAFFLFPALAQFLAGATSASAAGINDDPNFKGPDERLPARLKAAFYLGMIAVALIVVGCFLS